jgi:hypothetical protein
MTDATTLADTTPDLAPRHDFWVSSGHLLLDPDPATRGMVVTDAFLRAYLARPELMPPDEACDAERALHARLMAEPRADVTKADIAALADPDARENWELILELRARLLGAPTLEGAYARIARDGAGRLPPLFLDQIVHLLARAAIEDEGDPFVARAAEILFRPQRVTFHEGSTLLADADIIERHEHDRHHSPLLAMLGGPAVSEMPVLTLENASTYWSRSDAFDMAFDLGGSPGGRQALARALAAFIERVLGIRPTITPVEKVEDRDWRWFVGLDAQATAIGNRLWQGKAVSPEDQGRVLALFRLDLPADVPVIERVQGHPVWLMLAMDEERLVRVKPQNLIAGLPLRDDRSAHHGA